jgi:hypothetical protein
VRDVSIYTAANRRGWNKIALAVRTGGIALTGDYFGRAPHDRQHPDPAKRPAGWRPDADPRSRAETRSR